MAKALDLRLPWKLLAELDIDATTKFRCQDSTSNYFDLEITRNSDEIQLHYSGDLVCGGKIHIQKFKQEIPLSEIEVEFPPPELDYRFHRNSSIKSENIKIDRFLDSSHVTTENFESSQQPIITKRKRVQKVNKDFISTEKSEKSQKTHERDENEDCEMILNLVSSSIFNGLLNNYCEIKENSSGTVFSCKCCEYNTTSTRRFYCHFLVKHESLLPWQCAECSYKAAFQSLLVRHVAQCHGPAVELTEPKSISTDADTGTASPVTVNDDSSINDDANFEANSEPVVKAAKSGENVVSFTKPKRKSKLIFQRASLEQMAKTRALDKLNTKDPSATKVMEIEIEVQPEIERRSATSGVIRRAQEDTEPGGSIQVLDLSQTDQSHIITQAGNVTILEQPKTIQIQGNPDIDPRLRYVARNYQLIISEFCVMRSELFQCKLCYASYRKRNKFMAHLYSEHEECQPYYCLLCDFKSRGKTNIFTHNSFKHSDKERIYSCQACPMTFESRREMETHATKHHRKNQENIQCAECGKVFTTKRHYREHERKMHREPKHVCNVCNKSFSSAFSLKLHSNVHEPGPKWKCIYCQKLYRSVQSLKIHMHSHTTVFHCQICDKDIYSYSSFILHKNLHDPKAKKHACPHCPKVFPTKLIRDRHEAAKHKDKNTDHKCADCNKSFKLLNQLESHRICHSNDKPWICEVCGQAFKRQSSLCTHRNKHGQQNRAPFICSFCQQQFLTYPDLADHLVNDEKAGLCTLCHRLFGSRPLLEHHMMNAHHQEQIQQDSSMLEDYVTNRDEIPASTSVADVSTKSEKSHLSIQGPNLITYDSQGQPIIEGLRDRAIQIAPTKVKTKIIHSDRSSSVVAQIATTPVVDSGALVPRVVDGVVRPQTVQFTDETGKVIEVPLIDGNEIEVVTIDGATSYEATSSTLVEVKEDSSGIMTFTLPEGTVIGQEGMVAMDS